MKQTILILLAILSINFIAEAAPTKVTITKTFTLWRYRSVISNIDPELGIYRLSCTGFGNAKCEFSSGVTNEQGTSMTTDIDAIDALITSAVDGGTHSGTGIYNGYSYDWNYISESDELTYNIEE